MRRLKITFSSFPYVQMAVAVADVVQLFTASYSDSCLKQFQFGTSSSDVKHKIVPCLVKSMIEGDRVARSKDVAEVRGAEVEVRQDKGKDADDSGRKRPKLE